MTVEQVAEAAAPEATARAGREPFRTRTKRALAGAPDAPLVLLGNFEVEDAWAVGEVGLPSVGGASATAALVNRMDELALLLAGPGDHVVLKGEPDPDHLAHLDALGVGLPTVHVAESSDPLRTVTLDALDSPALLASLRGLAADGVRLLAHGTSSAEEDLAVATGLRSVLPGVATTKAVNSKVYSRGLCDELGIEQARGWACRTVEDFERACAEAARLVADGATVGVKDAYGVSGKGILVVDDPRRLDQLVRMVTRRAARSGDDRLAVVVEVWADKATDLNYHFTVAPDGAVTFDFVKEAITEGGVHKGHRIPSRLPAEQVDELAGLAERLGARLAADGFHGLVGVDALVRTDGGLLPVLEINARSNMSTYTVPLQERFLPPGWVALARQYPLVLDAPLPFAALHDRLGDLLPGAPGEAGLVVQATGTVNAGAASRAAGGTFAGRLHGLLVAPDDDALARLDAAVTERLAPIPAGATGRPTGGDPR
ncbi:ATP-grasp domain-containing protein [Cellulosimicrobium sp. BIT-GX5]|uniref:ATP-grasp domain-containing protein n=1 Tax=Cellulosimicrobium composti TaxID=2672572 RepID=A0A6N7ZNH0_9MICO|nr:ATP-grasp domain-containing protein [Cellulosimicrobium composti]MTG90809.1 ATP-grasp domain-containing protein [Cellulosimicrobium composti]